MPISSGQDRGPNFWGGGGSGFSGEGFEVEWLFLDFRRQLECPESSRPPSRERLNPSIGSDPLFYPAVILLDQVVQVLAGAYLHPGEHQKLWCAQVAQSPPGCENLR